MLGQLFTHDGGQHRLILFQNGQHGRHRPALAGIDEQQRSRVITLRRLGIAALPDQDIAQFSLRDAILGVSLEMPLIKRLRFRQVAANGGLPGELQCLRRTISIAVISAIRRHANGRF